MSHVLCWAICTVVTLPRSPKIICTVVTLPRSPKICTVVTLPRSPKICTVVTLPRSPKMRSMCDQSLEIRVMPNPKYLMLPSNWKEAIAALCYDVMMVWHYDYHGVVNPRQYLWLPLEEISCFLDCRILSKPNKGRVLGGFAFYFCECLFFNTLNKSRVLDYGYCWIIKRLSVL
jgi:hypothetical protein